MTKILFIDFCNVFHAWSDWQQMPGDPYQWRWCDNCSTLQRRLIKTKTAKQSKYVKELEKRLKRK